MKCKAIYFSAAICFLAVLGMVLSFVLTGGRTEQPILRYPSGTPEKISAVHGRRGVLIL